MSYFKYINGDIHFIEDDNFINLLPSGCTKITDAQAKKLQEPKPLTIDEQITQAVESVRLSLQSAIDKKAISLGFSGGNALMLYAGFTSPFQSLAQTFATWEASVWVEAETYKAQVILGEKPMLSPDEAVAMMPVYPG